MHPPIRYKIYDTSQSILVFFSTTCLCQRSWICAESLTRNLSWRKAVLKQRIILTHYIFMSPVPWKFLTRSNRSCASWLSAYHHELLWEDKIIPYSEAKRLITTAIWRWCYHVCQGAWETNVTVELVSGRWAKTHVHRDFGCSLQRHGIFNSGCC